jgi:hypothetical protein
MACQLIAARHRRSLHQADEDVLERTLAGAQVLEADALGEVLQQCCDAGALGLGVVGVDELVALSLQRQVVARERRSAPASGSCSGESQLLLAELAHQLGFSSTRMISPLLMTPIRSAISSASSM